MTDILILSTVILAIGLLIIVLLRQKPSGLNKELRNSLDEIGQAKDIISDHALRTMESLNDLGGNLHRIVQQQEQTQKIGESLKDLLQGPKLRGNYGEMVLEEMLDKALPRSMWGRQHILYGREAVDCAIKYRDVLVPIDSKFPRDSYLKYISAESEEEKSVFWKEFERAVRTQVTSIQSKYVKPEYGTSDFALMFIPSEAIYYETIADNNRSANNSSLLEYAQSRRVIPVSPNTLYAFLQVILLGIKNLEMSRIARDLQKNLAAVQKHFEHFNNKYVEVGRDLEKASEAYRISENHLRRYKSGIDTTLQIKEQDDSTETNGSSTSR